MAAYVAAIIGGANFWKTGFQAMRLCFVLYVIPFFFVYNPELILHGNSTLSIVESVLTAFIGVFILASCIEGYLSGIGKLNIMQRVWFGIIGFLLFFPEKYTDLIGIVLLVATVSSILLYRRHMRPISKRKY
jgi:TRAP-type uncharacterized transport system fused permease subunit